MAENSKIEWCDHTVNFWWGCTKVSEGCQHCYAEAIDNRYRPDGSTHWGLGVPRYGRVDKAYDECIALNNKAVKKKTRYRVFINSMSDFLDAEVDPAWLFRLMHAPLRCPSLDFLLLTKRPELWAIQMERLFDLYSKTDLSLFWNREKIPHNVWIGTTVENQARAEQRIPALLKIPARVRFLSCEPLLGPVDLKFTNHPEANNIAGYSLCGGGEQCSEIIEWVIAGGESGHKARPMEADWVRSLRDQCDEAAVSFFFKQWGGANKKAAGRVLDDVTWDEFPEDIMQYEDLPEKFK